MKIKHKVATCRNVTFQRICGLQKPKSAAFILATGLWGSCRNIAKEVTTCNHCCRLRYDTLVCTHPFLCESTPLLSWMHWNVLYHTLFLLQSDGLTTLGERRAAAFRALCTDWEWEFLQSRFKVYHYHSRNKREHSEHTFNRWETKKRCLNDCPQRRHASPLSRRVFCVSNVLLDTRMDGERRRCQ